VARDPRIDTDEDFIVAPGYNNSISKLIENYPNGVPDYIICRVLKITPDKLKETYKRAILKLKEALGEEPDYDDEI
jgi:hypothetical protein